MVKKFMLHIEPKMVLSGRGTILTSKFRAIRHNRLKLPRSVSNCTMSAMKPKLGLFTPTTDMSSISQFTGFKVAIGHFGHIFVRSSRTARGAGRRAVIGWSMHAGGS